MDAVRLRKSNMFKLNDDIQYKMESIINEIVMDVIKWHDDDIDDENEKLNIYDDRSVLKTFYNFYSNISNDLIEVYRNKYLISTMDQAELNKYINSYKVDVLGAETVENPFKTESNRINLMIFVSLDIFIHLNQQFILDSFTSLYSNVNLK